MTSSVLHSVFTDGHQSKVDDRNVRAEEFQRPTLWVQSLFACLYHSLKAHIQYSVDWWHWLIFGNKKKKPRDYERWSCVCCWG